MNGNYVRHLATWQVCFHTGVIINAVFNLKPVKVLSVHLINPHLKASHMLLYNFLLIPNLNCVDRAKHLVETVL